MNTFEHLFRVSGMMLAFFVSDELQAQAFIPPPQPAEGGAAEQYTTRPTENGAMLNFPEKGLSIAVPTHWQIDRNHPGATLLLQVPAVDKKDYTRTIHLLSFAGPRYMDEITAEGFKDELIKKFGSDQANVEGYKIRNYSAVTLDSGLPAYLFYADFKTNGFEMMHMHVLVSSTTEHFVLTYTDLAQNFVNETDPNSRLNDAWNVMGSVQVGDPVLGRFTVIYRLMLVALLVVLVGIGYTYMRRRADEQHYRDIAHKDLVPTGEDSEAVGALTRSPETLHDRLIDRQMLASVHEEEIVDEEFDEGYGDDSEVEFPKRKATRNKNAS